MLAEMGAARHLIPLAPFSANGEGGAQMGRQSRVAPCFDCGEVQNREAGRAEIRATPTPCASSRPVGFGSGFPGVSMGLGSTQGVEMCRHFELLD